MLIKNQTKYSTFVSRSYKPQRYKRFSPLTLLFIYDYIIPHIKIMYKKIMAFHEDGIDKDKKKVLHFAISNNMVTYTSKVLKNLFVVL